MDPIIQKQVVFGGQVLEIFFFLEQDSGSMGTYVRLSKVIKPEMDALYYFQIIP